jgi:hypothetical protein
MLSLQIREILFEVFDLLVLALPERTLGLAVLRAAPLFSLLVVQLAFCLRGDGLHGLHTAVCEEFLSTGVVKYGVGESVGDVGGEKLGE